jgi:hypothetical protein
MSRLSNEDNDNRGKNKKMKSAHERHVERY